MNLTLSLETLTDLVSFNKGPIMFLSLGELAHWRVDRFEYLARMF